MIPVILNLLGYVMAAIYDFDLVAGTQGISVITNETERELVLKCIENNITDIGIVKKSEDDITIYTADSNNETYALTDLFMDCFEDNGIDTGKYGFTSAYGLVGDEGTLHIATILMGSEAVAKQQEENRYWTEYYEKNPHLLSLHSTVNQSEPMLGAVHGVNSRARAHSGGGCSGAINGKCVLKTDTCLSFTGSVGKSMGYDVNDPNAAKLRAMVWFHRRVGNGASHSGQKEWSDFGGGKCLNRGVASIWIQDGSSDPLPNPDLDRGVFQPQEQCQGY